MKNYLLILLWVFIISLGNNGNGYDIRYLEDSDNHNPIMRCGEDNFTPIPLSSTHLLPYDEKKIQNQKKFRFGWI